nr:hypothetical protein BaRGS_020498 [Batillaria attramentaria]
MSVTDSDLLDGFGFVTDVNDYDDVTTPTYGNVTSNVTIPVAQGGNVYQYALPPRELYYYHVVYFSVAIALGVPGNALVIAAYASLRRKSSSDWYILYIAVLDLIICLFRVPTHLAMEIGEWKLGTDALCKLVYWVSQSVITASVFLFAFIAIDRYIKICRPTMRISARFARNCIVGITVGSLLFTIPVFWLYTNSPLANKCVVIASPSALSLMRVYYTALFAAFLVMFVIVVVCYSLLFAKGLGAKPVKAARGKGSSTLQVPNQIRGIDLDKTLRHYPDDNDQLHRYFRQRWIPPYVAMVWYFYVGYTPPLSATDIAVQTYAPTGYILNSFVNPFLYVALSPAFRNTVISLWRKFSRCGRGQG